MSQDLIVSGDTYEGVERVAATNTEGGLVVYGDGDGEASSPTIAVAPIEGGYRITVTDVAGSRSFDMKNGLSPTINITETPFADANGAGSAIKITCVSKDPVTGEETESSETVYVRNGKNGLHGTDVTLDITRQSGDDPGWWFKKKQTVYNADGTTKVTETTDFIPVSDDFVIAKISGSLRDDTLEWEYTVLCGENPAPAAGLNALVESGKIVIGVADGDLGFRFFADEAYNDSYVVPSGTVFNYNNGTFWFSNFADKDGEIKNMAFAIKAGYKDSPWWGMTYPSQYTIYLTGDQPGRIVECFGRKLEPREAYEILLDAANNDIPLLCYQKDAVFKLEDGSTHTPQYGTPFYYDHNTELLHCEHDGYACTLYVDLDVYNATAEKNTPYKTAESKADDLKAEDGTLFLLSAGEPIGAGVPLPTGNADDCKIFIADLNTSTYEDIKAADDAGKICYALWGGYTPCLLTTLSPESAIFTTLLDPYHGKYVKFTKGTVGVSDFGLTESHSVLYEQQSLTDAQKAQARENIGALSADDIDVDSIGSNVFVADYDTTTFAEIKAAHDAGKVCFLNFNGISLPLLGTNDTEAMFVREINENTDYRVTITSAGGKDFTIVDKNISDVYVVSLFSAKYAEVKAAFDAGKACFVTYGALLCPLTVLDEEKAEFVGMLTPNMGIKGIVPAEGTIDWTYVRSNAVQTVEQSLSDDQKAQARTNIGAAAAADLSNYVTTGTAQTITGAKTFNAPANVAGTEQHTVKFKTSNGGAIIFGKEAANSGTMLRFDQVDGTTRLRFRGSDSAGAIVWEQPEQGAQLYVDLGKQGVDKHRINFPSSGGTLALTSQIPSLSGYLPLSGGLMTGSLKFQAASLPGKSLQYVCGVDAFGNGGEMGWQSKADFLSGYLTTTGTAAKATADANGNNIASTYANKTVANTFNGEQKMVNSTHCPTMNDIANGVGCSLKNARACDNQLIVAEIFAPTTTVTDSKINMSAVAGEIGFYHGGSGSGGQFTGKTQLARITSAGIYEGSTLLSDKYLAKSGGTMAGPLWITGGDSATAGKLILNNNGRGQITDSGSSTLFGFVSTGNLTVGHGYYNLVMRGKASRPTYNGANVALVSDVVEAANGSLKVTLSGTSVDKTLAQIETALNAGRHVYLVEGINVYQLSYHMDGMVAAFTSVLIPSADAQVSVRTVMVWDGMAPSVFTKTL